MVFLDIMYGLLKCLEKQNWRKQINHDKLKITEAKAHKESAIFEAEAEVERAKGMAKANKIVGDSLKGHENYLKYLYIQNMHQTKNQVIYIPTEGGLPILEANRLK